MRPLSLDTLVDGRGDRVAVGQVDLVPVTLPAGLCTAAMASSGRLGPLDAGQLALDQRGRGPLAAGLDALGQLALRGRPCRTTKRSRSGSAGSGSGDEVEEVEGAAGGGSQVGDDGRDDAACGAGDHEHRVGTEGSPGTAVCGRARSQADGPAQAGCVADLDGARVALGLLEEEVGELLRSSARLEVDGLHESVGALALVGLGEAGDGAAHRRRGPGVVVAVAAAQAGGADKESFRAAATCS